MPERHIRQKELYLYVALWAIIILLYVLHIMSEHASDGKTLFTPHDIVRSFRVLAPLFVLFVINNYILIPKLLFKNDINHIKRYAVCALILTAAIALWQYFDYVSFRAHHPMHIPTDMEHYPPPPHRRSILPMPYIHDLICAGLVIGVNLAISLVSRQIVTNLEHQRLIAANMADQLEHLKTQISPHFYMNMLNNIHGLVDLNPEKAKEMLLDMSRLMRYMLYESSRPTIALTKEIDFLKDYVKVMQGRFAKTKVCITASFPTRAEASGIEVPPLLFLVFIENAFKHGIDYRHESFVTISMEVTDGRIHFGCLNSRIADSRTSKDKSGIGLENIGRRLRLIYGNEAELNINQTADTYSVSMTIPTYETENNNH